MRGPRVDLSPDATITRSITNVLASRVRDTTRRKQLLAIFVANPEDKFGQDEIFGIARYWHHRSAENLLMLFPGYRTPEDAAGNPRKAFDPEGFTPFVKWIEEKTDVRYRSLALILVAVGWRDAGDHDEWRVDWTHIFEIRLEELVEQKLVEHPKTLIEDLIAFAKTNAAAPDDAMVQLKDALEADVVGPTS